MRVAANSLKLGAVLVVSTTALAAGIEPPSLPRWRSAPWQFLDATAEITQPQTLSRFRAAIEGDLDRDGDLDVIVARAISDQGVEGTPTPGQLFMNEGGRFVERTSTVLPQLANAQVRWWANVADFGGPAGPPDGWPDVFIAGGQGEASRFFLNKGRDGSGNFLGFQEDPSRIVNSPISSATNSYNARTGDFNGDGLTDLVVFQYKPNLGSCTAPFDATCFGQTRLLININGVLTDETATRLPARNEPSIFGVVSDFNGDGAADIALVNLKNGLVPGNYSSVPSVRVLINDGAGMFPTSLAQTMPERLNPSSGLGTYSLEAGDFNGDGRNDLFIINWGIAGHEERDGVLLNLGSGNNLFPGGQAGIGYPQINPALDDDGDQPVAADLDGDGLLDVVVAQFATKPYVLMNRSRGGHLVLVESTPPQVPNAIGFRNKVFDANSDGVPDMWFALRDRNFLVLGGLPESEPNQNVAEANPTTAFPSLRTGILQSGDEDVFSLPAATSAGARIRLRPASNGDLRLRILNAAGASLFVSEVAGNGAVETIDLAPGSGAAFARVERQGVQAGNAYRLEILRPGTSLTEEAETLSSPRVRPRQVTDVIRRRGRRLP